MTGGLAWVNDPDGSFLREERFHPDFVTPACFAETSPEAQRALHELLEQHRAESFSTLASSILQDWPRRAETFVLLTPKPQA